MFLENNSVQTGLIRLGLRLGIHFVIGSSVFYAYFEMANETTSAFRNKIPKNKYLIENLSIFFLAYPETSFECVQKAELELCFCLIS